MTTEIEIAQRLAATIPKAAEQPGMLAALRRAAGRQPLDLPETWPLVVPVVHDSPWAEAAVHHSLTLYAVHQQSLAEPMHRSGVGVGRASKILQQRTDSGGAQRRLLAAASAQSVGALAAQLRGLVTLLRGEQIALDYVRLARDLLAWPHPQRAAVVRRRWAREFHGTDLNGVTGTESDAAVTAAASQKDLAVALTSGADR